MVLKRYLSDQIPHGRNLIYTRRRVTRAPNVAPAAWLLVARNDVNIVRYIDRIAFRQRVRIEASRDD